VSKDKSKFLWMGLYDDPLPPSPPPANSPPPPPGRRARLTPPKNFFPSVNCAELSSLPRLFRFSPDGEEEKALLPPLKRSLRSGVPCYFEPEDRQAVAVAKRTECHPMDACWALEALEGDIAKACVAIALARRKGLEDGVKLEEGEVDWDTELRDLMEGRHLDVEMDARPVGRDGLEERRTRIQTKNIKDHINGYFDAGNKDQTWLPGKPNPNPIDHEPWFTG